MKKRKLFQFSKMRCAIDVRKINRDLYCPTGAIWIANTEALMGTKSFYGPGYRFYPMPWKKAIDIDDYEDLEMTKLLISLDQ